MTVKRRALPFVFFAVAAFICVTGGGEARAGQIDLSWSVRGGGVLLEWSVAKTVEAKAKGFKLRVTDGSGKSIAEQNLPADARSHFLPLWLGEGEKATVQLSLQMDRIFFGGGATRTLSGPFHETDVTVTGKVEEVHKTGCSLTSVKVSGEGKVEVRVFSGPDLLGTVSPGESELEIDGLEPATCYVLALAPFLLQDGKERRGRPILLPSFTTPSDKGWAPANGGNRLNGDRSLDLKYGVTQAFSDKVGNLLFTIPCKAVRPPGHGSGFFNDAYVLGTGMGRFGAKSRTWEIRGIDGWTADKGVPIRPVFDQLYRMQHFEARHDPSGRLYAVTASAVTSGKLWLDVHGALNHFRWRDDQWEQWTGGTAFSRYASRPLTSSWAGTGGAWGFDANRKGIGLLAHINRGFSSKGRIMMARLDLRNPESLWSVWHEGAWKPHAYSVTFVPDPSPPKTLDDNSPKVVCIDGKNLWMVLFRRAKDAHKGPKFWTGLLYDDRKKTWHRWTKEGWATEGELTALFSPDVEGHTVRVFREKGGKVILLGQKGSAFLRFEYNTYRKKWADGKPLAEIAVHSRRRPSYCAALSPAGRLFVAYSEDGVGISVHGRGRVFRASGPIVPCAVGYFQRIPVILYGEGKALKAIAERPLPREKVTEAPPFEEVRAVKTPDPAMIEYLGSFINNAKDPKIPEGAKSPVGPSYRDQQTGHMACTPEGLLFAPRFTVCGICIFPPGHPEKPATFWGGFWDYFNLPQGVAVDPVGGKVYVGHRVAMGGGGGVLGGVVDIWDLKEASTCHWVKPGLRGKSRARAIQPGRIKDTFRWPSGMIVDAKRRHLYIANSLLNDVRKFDLTGDVPKRIGVFGDKDLDFPHGLALDGEGNLYVVDNRHHRIAVFDQAGSLLRAFGSWGRAPGKFLYPWGIAIEPSTGLVFVTDPQNDRVQVFDGEGNLKTWWNRFSPAHLGGEKKEGGNVRRGTPAGDHGQSFGVACDGRGHVYISTGKYIAKFKVKKK
ncbi:MAG: NHL repeat-containing protein [Planctomycetota bacterium]|jgi:DNA-binding beta-propeller fold protein YncE